MDWVIVDSYITNRLEFIEQCKNTVSDITRYNLSSSEVESKRICFEASLLLLHFRKQLLNDIFLSRLVYDEQNLLILLWQALQGECPKISMPT